MYTFGRARIQAVILTPFKSTQEREKPDESSPECAVGVLSLLTQDTYLPTRAPEELVRETLVEFRSVHMPLTTSLTSPRIGASYHFKYTSVSQSSLAGLRSKRADVGVGASLVRTSVLYTCSPNS